MKRIKFLSLFFIAISAMVLTSCLNDDDDESYSSLTPAEIMQCFNLTKGSHTGKLIYQRRASNGNFLTTNDTIGGSWYISTDSTMSFRNVYASALASAIADTTIMKAVAQQMPVNISAKIGYVNVTPTQWIINPSPVTYDNVNYNGGTHKIELYFATNSTWSYGQASTKDNKQGIQLVIWGMYVDGKPDETGIVQLGNSRVKPLIFIEQ